MLSYLLVSLVQKSHDYEPIGLHRTLPRRGSMQRSLLRSTNEQGPVKSAVGPLCCAYYLNLGVQHDSFMLYQQKSIILVLSC